MTGFGHGECRRHTKQVIVNLSSVNRKQLDIRLSLPSELLQCEPELRSCVKDTISRGAIQAQFTFGSEDPANTVSINIDAARSCWEQLKKLEEELGLENTLTIRDLLNIPDIFFAGAEEIDQDELTSMCLEAITSALEALIVSRSKEGEAMRTDLVQRQENLCGFLNKIEKLAPSVPKEYKERLQKRLQDIDKDLDFDEDRLLKEVMFFADRSDISEEVTRLNAHLPQMLELLNSDGVIGRKIDFLIQETVREINTIGSKAANSDIARYVVEFKTELERIREQIQNIE